MLTHQLTRSGPSETRSATITVSDGVLTHQQTRSGPSATYSASYTLSDGVLTHQRTRSVPSSTRSTSFTRSDGILTHQPTQSGLTGTASGSFGPPTISNSASSSAEASPSTNYTHVVSPSPTPSASDEGERTASAAPSVSLSTTRTLRGRGGGNNSFSPTLSASGDPNGGRRTPTPTDTWPLYDANQTYGPPNVTNVPSEEGSGAGTEDGNGGGIGGELLRAAAPEPKVIFVGSPCHPRLLRFLIAPQALATPLPALGLFSALGGAMLANLVVLAGAVALGALAALVAGCVSQALESRSSYRFGDPNQSAPSVLLRGATVAAFPATAIECFGLLSHGAALASGLALGDAIRGGSAAEGLDLVAAVVGAFAVVAAPFAWAAAARAVRGADGWSVAVAPVGDEAAEARRLRRIGDDDDLPLPEGAYAVPAAGAEGSLPPARPQQTAFLCAAIRPASPARRLGPIAGDLSGRFVGSVAGPAVHGVLAALMLVAAAVGAAASDGCGAVLIAAGAAVGVYSVAVVAVRPYLGLWHNATEAVFGLAAAACLVAWGVASLTDEERSGGAAAASECPSGVSSLPYVLSGLANCRYPFIIARCLGVGVPSVARIVPGRQWWSFRKRPFVRKSGDAEPLSAGTQPAVALSSLETEEMGVVFGPAASSPAIYNDPESNSDNNSNSTSVSEDDHEVVLASASDSSSDVDLDFLGGGSGKAAARARVASASSVASAVALSELPRKPKQKRGSASLLGDADDDNDEDGDSVPEAAIDESGSDDDYDGGMGGSGQFSAYTSSIAHNGGGAFDEEDF